MTCRFLCRNMDCSRMNNVSQIIALPLYYLLELSLRQYALKWHQCGADKTVLTYWHLGLYSLRIRRLISIGIPIINLRRSSDRLRFITGIPIPVRRRLLSEYRPWTGQMSPIVMHKRSYSIVEDWHVLHEIFRRLKGISHLAWMFYHIHLCIYCSTTFCRSAPKVWFFTTSRQRTWSHVDMSKLGHPSNFRYLDSQRYVSTHTSRCWWNASK